MEPLLRLTNLVVGYGDTVIVDGVSLSVSAGEMVAIVGPNGAGKSTLIKAVAGLLTLRAGTIVFAGRDITGRPPHQRARGGLAYVPQIDNVFRTLSVEQNLRLGTQHLPRNKRSARVSDAMSWFPELERLSAQSAGTLSGGQRQMLTLSRALLLEPTLLVVDEPTAGLSPLMAQNAFATLDKVRGSGTAVLVVEQNVDLALETADRMVVLSTGREVFSGTPGALLKDDRLVELYLGGAHA